MRDPADEPDSILLHGTTVAVGGAGLLITGAAGSGKSALALMLMAYGAVLIADDRTRLTRRDDGLWASCPPTIRGRIEARGLGILAAETLPGARLAAVVDLDRSETERLPPERTLTLIGLPVALILKTEGLSFAAALHQYLLGERCA
jgi:HPr kinase/phosphorylase